MVPGALWVAVLSVVQLAAAALVASGGLGGWWGRRLFGGLARQRHHRTSRGKLLVACCDRTGPGRMGGQVGCRRGKQRARRSSHGCHTVPHRPPRALLMTSTNDDKPCPEQTSTPPRPRLLEPDVRYRFLQGLGPPTDGCGGDDAKDNDHAGSGLMGRVVARSLRMARDMAEVDVRVQAANVVLRAQPVTTGGDDSGAWAVHGGVQEEDELVSIVLARFRAACEGSGFTPAGVEAFGGWDALFYRARAEVWWALAENPGLLHVDHDPTEQLDDDGGGGGCGDDDDDDVLLLPLPSPGARAGEHVTEIFATDTKVRRRLLVDARAARVPGSESGVVPTSMVTGVTGCWHRFALAPGDGVFFERWGALHRRPAISAEDVPRGILAINLPRTRASLRRPDVSWDAAYDVYAQKLP